MSNTHSNLLSSIRTKQYKQWRNNGSRPPEICTWGPWCVRSACHGGNSEFGGLERRQTSSISVSLEAQLPAWSRGREKSEA